MIGKLRVGNSIIKNEIDDWLKCEHLDSIGTLLGIGSDLHDIRAYLWSGGKGRTSILKKFAVCTG